MREVTSLRFVVFQEGDLWSAQCLEFDVASQGASAKEASLALLRAVNGHLLISRQQGMRPLKSLPPAPKRFWKMFEAGERQFTTEMRAAQPATEVRVAPQLA